MHKLSENLKVDPAMNFATLNNSSNTPLWVSMKNYNDIMTIIHSQTIAAGGALTCQLRQATSAAGAGAKNITGKTAAFTDAEDNTTKTIDCRAEDLDINNSFIYVGILITETGVQNAGVDAEFVRGNPRYAQATLPA